MVFLIVLYYHVALHRAPVPTVTPRGHDRPVCDIEFSPSPWTIPEELHIKQRLTDGVFYRMQTNILNGKLSSKMISVFPIMLDTAPAHFIRWRLNNCAAVEGKINQGLTLVTKCINTI